MYDTASGRRILPLNFHQELAEAIIAGDPQRAESAMRGHVQFGLKAVLQAIEPQDGEHWRQKPDRTSTSNRRNLPRPGLPCRVRINSLVSHLLRCPNSYVLVFIGFGLIPMIAVLIIWFILGPLRPVPAPSESKKLDRGFTLFP
jgi:hypothetical protein